jgi:glycosyltransferase involved in cell wall biosynthesis
MREKMKTISIAAYCYNEVGNIRDFYDRCKAVIAKHPGYDYEFCVSDNCSIDGTRDLLRQIAAEDPKFKVILNANNFGHIRSPYNALISATGDAVVWMCTDLQDPPEVISRFIRHWEAGAKVVVGVRCGTRASVLLEFFRRLYYWLLAKSSHGVSVIPRFTGFGLYDRVAVDALRKFKDPYPYVRGMISEIGFKRVTVSFVQGKRKTGGTKNNWFTLYDMAMTGFVNHTKVPLRLSVFFSFLLGTMSFIVMTALLVLKLCYWEKFHFGIAPILIAQFFFASVQLFFLGVIGEYLGAIWTHVKNKPLVIEEERLNF